jgi:exodeoxyribonuclease-3
MDRFVKRAASLLASGEPVVLAGDYNIIPTEKDAYKPERWVNDALFQPEVRTAFKDLVDSGWTDALRKQYPDEVVYTFWDYFRNAYGRNAGLRIDHLLLSPPLKKRFKRAGVDHHVRGWEKSSDHTPVWVEVSGE